MGHYIGSIEEHNGEREYTQSFLFTSTRPEGTLKRIARTWYGKADPEYPPMDTPDGGFWFDCGEIYVEPHSFKKITVETYNVIKDTGALVEM